MPIRSEPGQTRYFEPSSAAAAAFGAALRRYRVASGYPTQTQLATAVQVSHNAVGAWEKGVNVPGPATVFELEELLLVPPGTLSHHLGYVPTNFHLGVLAAIADDDELDDEGKTMLEQMYKALSGQAAGRKRRGR